MSRLAAVAAFSGALGVIAGAFGAHWASVTAAPLLKTGAEYEMIHAIAALLAVRMGAGKAGWLLLGGSLLFALSIYGLALGGPRVLGPVTPIGGAGMIAGWIWLGVVVLRQK